MFDLRETRRQSTAQRTAGYQQPPPETQKFTHDKAKDLTHGLYIPPPSHLPNHLIFVAGLAPQQDMLCMFLLCVGTTELAASTLELN